MPEVRITIKLPYLLRLPDGGYSTPFAGGSVRLGKSSATSTDNLATNQTAAWSLFDAPDEDEEALERRLADESRRLLNRVNHLLRWYRATIEDASIIELTRASASPFVFTLESTGEGYYKPVAFEPLSLPKPPLTQSVRRIASAVRNGLKGKTEPDVATLNLLDAEYALGVGRFRDAVLLCWGTIDATYVRKFEMLVDEGLEDEWPGAREFLKGFDFGLRHKMTAGLRLLTGRSLFNEPDDYWNQMTESYRCRNSIIHEGAMATEQDAETAIRIARKMVEIAAELKIKRPRRSTSAA